MPVLILTQLLKILFKKYFTKGKEKKVFPLDQINVCTL